MGGCASIKRNHNAESVFKMTRWDDNRALREASLEELNQEQLLAFDHFWEKVYVNEILALPAEIQNQIEIAIEERKNDPSKAEAYKASLREIFDSLSSAGYLSESECMTFLEKKQAFERR